MAQMIQQTSSRIPKDRRHPGVRRGRAVAAALALAAVLPVAACGGEPAQPEPQRTPNIVLVTIDTLRADHLEAYGYPRATAPFLARLAASGVRFARGISQAPWTLPAMASVHSSLLPSQHGAIEAETALPEAAETLAERLRAAGYATVAVVSHEFVSAKHGFAQGFEVFDESNVLGHEAVTSRDLTMTALARLSEVQQPFFLWVHYFDPHFTYVRHPEFGFADGYTGALPEQITSGRLLGEERRAEPMADYDLDYVKAVYDEEIAYTDEWIGTLWQGLADRYGDDTVIVVTGDHGEYFLERGRFFHGKDVYRELVDVPLIIAGAIDEDLRGTVVEPAVATLDIPRTVLGVLGLPADGFGGIDLLEVARGAEPLPVIAEGTYAFGTDARTEGVQYRGFKLIHRLDDDGYELYDLGADPRERNDVFAEYGAGSDIVERLMQSLHWLRDQPRLEPQPVGLTPEALERLRQLGYIR